MSILKKAKAALVNIDCLDDAEIVNAVRLADLYSDIKPETYSLNSNGIFAHPENRNQILFAQIPNR